MDGQTPSEMEFEPAFETTFGNDIEAQKTSKGATNKDSSTAMQEAAALLMVWSLLVINEGAVRTIAQNPTVGLLEAGRPSKFMPFLAGLFEVTFGLFGLFVGVSAFLLKQYSTAMTKLCMVVQSILGYFVFAMFVFVIPVFRAIDMTASLPPGLTVGQSRTVIAMGILTSFHFCLALQGGQFVFMARLICGATGDNFLSQATGNRMRAIFWNVNLGLSGLWTMITGAVIDSNLGGGRLAEPFVTPPNIGVLPGMTVIVGMVMLVWGGVGIAMALLDRAPAVYFAGTGVVYVVALLNFGLVQIGLIENGSGGVVALHNGLVFMVFFMGAYFVQLSATERVGDGDRMTYPFEST